MKLSKIKLSNFKCFGENETVIDLDEKITTFVGCNSSGKSSIMEAILKVISQNSNQRIIKKSDFHVPRNKTIDEIDEIKMYIELVFSFEELVDDAIDYPAVSANFRHMVINDVGEVPILRIRLTSTFSKSNNPEGSIDTEINYVYSPESTPIDDLKLCSAKRKDLDLIRAIYIPSTRNIEKEIKYVSGTLIERIFKLVKWDKNTKDIIKKETSDLNNKVTSDEQVKIIDNSISNNWKKFNIDKKFTDTKIEFASSEISELLKKIDIGFSPSIEDRNYLISELGDGSRSLFYFSMVNSLLDIERKLKNLNNDPEMELPLLTIVIAEEPENHVSPHLLGQLVSSLTEVCGSTSQVIITSHSPAIIERVEPENIRLVRNGNDYQSTVTRVNIPSDSLQAYKLIKETVQKNPQLYFSKMVIIVEGDTEKYVLPKFFKANNIDLDLNSISIITLGSRFVDKMWRVLENLKIKYITFIDLDNERICGGYHKLHELLNCIKNINNIDYFIKFSDGNNFFDKEIEKSLLNSPYDLENQYIKEIINFLETKNIMFSYPLDFDFMLLTCFYQEYINTIEKNEKGPMINRNCPLKDISNFEVICKNQEYISRLNSAIQNTLKDGGGDGSKYTPKEKNLMIWYDYLFLGKGKVNTHFKVFSKIDNIIVNNNMPECIKKLIEKIEVYINE